MKAKKLVSSLALLGLGVSLFAPSTLAAAGAADDKNVTGTGTIQYQEDTTPGGGPTDPEKPETDPDKKPTDPGDGQDNKNTGALRVDWVSNLNFETQNVTTGTGVYNATKQTITKADGTKADRGNFVQVTDKRSADKRGNGWKLSAKMTKQFTNSVNELKGATISYDNAFVNTEVSDAKPSIDLQSPGSKTLKYNESVDFLAADSKTGWGTYTLEFGRPVYAGDSVVPANETDTTGNSVILTVPAGTPLSTKDAYVAEITWTIAEIASSSTPTEPEA